MKKVIALIAVVVVAGIAATVVGQDSIPSSKAAVALGDLVALGPANTNDPENDADTGWVTVMQTLIKTSNGKDLYADVALQCGLITDTTVRSKGGDKDGSQAQADIRVRVKATDVNNTEDVRYFAPNEGATIENPVGDPELGVRYCDRLQKLEAKFAGLNCTADLGTGVVTCTEPEELRLLLETLNANAFNFLLADVDSGVWQIEVQARGQAAVDLDGTELGEAGAEAFVGLGSTVIETIRLVKDTDLVPITELE